MRTETKLGLLGTLYFSQGLPYGFFTQALPVFMRQQGLSLADIGLSSLLAMPWALKFLWAPLVDRHGSARFGRKKSWIVPLQVLAALTVVGLAFVDPKRGLQVLVAGVLLTNLLAATQDIATDALAVNLLEPEERGHGNGLQVAAYRVGMIVGGGAILYVFDRLGWQGSFLVMALLLALATVPIVLTREPPSAIEGPRGAVWSPFIAFLRRPGILPWLVVLLIYKWGEAFGSGMVRPFLVDQGLGLEQIGLVLGGIGFTAGLLGALAGGWGAGRLGRKRALLVFGVLQALAIAAYVLPARGIGGRELLYAVCTIEHFTGGMATVALFTMMMDASRPEDAGTDYTVQASLVVIATGGASSVSGFSAGRFGYPTHFALAFAACLAGLAVVAAILSREDVTARPGAAR